MRDGLSGSVIVSSSLIISSSLVVASWLIGSATVSAAEVDLRTDVVYDRPDGTEVRLDLALPADRRRDRPAVLVIHGGGWKGGDKSQHRDDIRELARQGFVAASVGYRLMPDHRFPDPVNDVRAAVRFVRNHCEEFGVDGERLGAVGFSAGAHLAMMLGVVDDGDGFVDGDTPSDVRAVVSYFGPTDLTADVPAKAESILNEFLGGTQSQRPDAYRRASPVRWVDPRDAPMLLFHGTRDFLVPMDQAVRMAKRLSDNSVDGRAELIFNAGHGWGGETLERTHGETLRFLDKHLRSKD